MNKKDFQEKRPFWMKLDNAAKIFPGQNSRTWANSFRVSFELNEKIVPEILRQAIDDIIPRFPCYGVKMRYGFFWYYLEKNEAPIIVSPDIKNPCHRIDFKENNRYLFRVYYHENRIAVDFYHVLTDGHGASLFLATLTAQYLRLCGHKIPVGGAVLDLTAPATTTELEDSFVKNADSKAKFKRADKFVYHAKGTRLPYHTVNIISGILSFDELHRITREKDVTITEFLAAVMLDVLIKKQEKEEKKLKEISVQIPVDLRRVFDSDTLRNFTICMRVKVDPNKGEYTFDELLQQVKLQLRLANDRKEHNMMITANMGLERNAVIRAMPLFIKNLGVGLSFQITAEQTTSALITNLGNVSVPEEMRQYVKKFIFMPAPGKVNAARCGVATSNNNLVITFSDVYIESDVEREFFTRFVKMGLHVKIESNRE